MARVIPPPVFRENIRSEWMLRPDIAFLNHGSFGAVPRCVFEEQERWRRRIEAEPVELLGRRCRDLLDESKGVIGQWLGMAPEDFGFVTNATEGINAVLRSLQFRPEDELVTTTHVYNAVRQTMRHVAQQTGAGYREIDIPLPLHSARQIVDAVAGGLSARTKMLVIDHITSPTGLVFPVEAIAAVCAQRGIDVLIDGAHAPGMLPLNVPGVGAAYYAGNLHKWTCAPKGAGFLWVRPDRQAGIHPAVVSHDWGSGLAAEFNWQGTRDISAWLSVPRAMAFMAELGWEKVQAHNHALAVWAHQMLQKAWEVEPVSPLDGQLLGSMATLNMPGWLPAMNDAQAPAVQHSLYVQHGIEVPLFSWGGQWRLRVSCQVYNHPEEYEKLGKAIREVRIPELTATAGPRGPFR
jgi:isopenicillin-N epimerase